MNGEHRDNVTENSSSTSPPWLFVVYHKTGCVFTFKLLKHFDHDLDWYPQDRKNAHPWEDMYLVQNMLYSPNLASTLQQLEANGRSYRIVHMIRDPKELVVSAYRFHYRAPEMWTHLPVNSGIDENFWTLRVPVRLQEARQECTIWPMK